MSNESHDIGDIVGCEYDNVFFPAIVDDGKGVDLEGSGEKNRICVRYYNNEYEFIEEKYVISLSSLEKKVNLKEIQELANKFKAELSEKHKLVLEKNDWSYSRPPVEPDYETNKKGEKSKNSLEENESEQPVQQLELTPHDLKQPQVPHLVIKNSNNNNNSIPPPPICLEGRDHKEPEDENISLIDENEEDENDTILRKRKRVVTTRSQDNSDDDDDEENEEEPKRKKRKTKEFKNEKKKEFPELVAFRIPSIPKNGTFISKRIEEICSNFDELKKEKQFSEEILEIQRKMDNMDLLCLGNCLEFMDSKVKEASVPGLLGESIKSLVLTIRSKLLRLRKHCEKAL